MGKKPDKDRYEHGVTCLQQLEQLAEQELIALYYGDETGVSTQGYCPYGWQGRAERVSIAVLPASHQRLNCFGCISRTNEFYYTTTTKSVDGEFIVEQLEAFSHTLSKPTFLILDNAPVHKTGTILRCLERWQQRGLYLFYLPPYSPHLNIAETLWRVLKGKWLEVQDYLSADTLFKATRQCLSEVGSTRTIHFAPFTIT